MSESGKMKWNSKLVTGCRIFEYSLEGEWKYVERITKRGSFKATIENMADVLRKFEFIINN